MINRLRLKQTIIRRFTVELGTDSDDDSTTATNGDKSGEPFGRRPRQSSPVDIIDLASDEHEIDLCLEAIKRDDNSSCIDVKGFTNYTIHVKNYGQQVERYVNTRKGLVAIKDRDLDQVIDCKNLTDIEKLVDQINLNSTVNEAVKLKKKKKKKRQTIVKSNGHADNGTDRSVENTKSSDSSNDSSSSSHKETLNGNNIDADDERELQEIGRQLFNEGVNRIKTKNSNQFKCKVCESIFKGYQKAMAHISSDDHLKIKFGDNLKGVDALLTIDSEDIGDVRIAIFRRRELKKINTVDKERFLSHGIRLKDGYGRKAYICLTCDLNFRSLGDVIEHMNSIPTMMTTAMTTTTPNIAVDISSTKPKSLSQSSLSNQTSSLNKIDQRLQDYGIVVNNNDNNYYCNYCKLYFECRKHAFKHSGDPRHKMIQNVKTSDTEDIGDGYSNSSKLEHNSQFLMDTDRYNDFDVDFWRRDYLKTIPMDTKIQLTTEGIRLRDGIGANAFYCQKCEQSIDKYEEIKSHIKSLFHTMA